MYNEEWAIKILVIMVLMVLVMTYFMKKITTDKDKK